MNRSSFLPRGVDLAIAAVALLLDQLTKFWAMARFDGVARQERIQVIGDLWRFELAFNEGAAFSLKPQNLLPWLPQTLFYLLLGAGALAALLWLYKSLPSSDRPSRYGTMLVIAGALGNLIDRVRIGKVIDFIDWDFPDIQIGNWVLERWPTFNLADSWVLIGVALLLLSPYLGRKPKVESE